MVTKSKFTKRKQFVIKDVERIRIGTYKFYVDAGRDGDLRIIVYPSPLPMQVFGPDDVRWLESDLDPKDRLKLQDEVRRMDAQQ